MGIGRRRRCRPPAAPGARPAPPSGPRASRTRARPAFVQQHTQAAQAAEAQTGIPAAFMLGQAAHESGWGRREIRHADGSPVLQPVRHQGRRRLERRGRRDHDHGGRERPGRKGVARFRAYASHAESFADYARLMKDNPRYRRCWRRAQDAERLCHGPAARRLRHRPGLRRQADARHQHHAAPAARCDLKVLRHERIRPCSRIGTKAMTASYAALATTGHNISNANVKRLLAPAGRAGHRARASPPAPASSARAWT